METPLSLRKSVRAPGRPELDFIGKQSQQDIYLHKKDLFQGLAHAVVGAGKSEIQRAG